MDELKLIWSVDDLKLDVDAVLRGQGADPTVLRKRKPRLLEIAVQALEIGRDLLDPQVFIQKFGVESLRHEKLILEGDFSMGGAWITRQLAPADFIYAILCTVGERVEKAASKHMDSDMMLGLALDGVGSAGVEALAQLVCKQIEDQAVLDDLQTTVPLSPGMINWSVEDGQPVIFELLNSVNTLVTLTPSFLMRPRKSLSMLLGVGASLGEKGSTCDYCAMQGTCKYRQYDDHNQVQ